MASLTTTFFKTTRRPCLRPPTLNPTRRSSAPPAAAAATPAGVVSESVLPEVEGTSFFSIGGIMGFDPDSGFPIEEQVCAKSAKGDFLASNWRRKKTGEKRENMKFEVRGFVAALFEEAAVIDGAILSGV